MEYIEDESDGGPPEIPQSLDRPCDKKEDSPDHHDRYLSMADMMEICQGKRDHKYASNFRELGETKLKSITNSVLLVSVVKVVKQTKKKV